MTPPVGSLPAVLAVLTALALGCSAGPSDLHGANVVVIVIDTLRADHLPSYGYPKDTAPFLTRLASQGARFSRAHSSSSWTAPATASLVTSVHPFQHQVTRGFVDTRRKNLELRRIPTELETLAELFRSHGYVTFGASDNINIAPEEGFDRGFDFFSHTISEGAESMNARVLAWEAELRAAPRYLLYLHYMDPHTPYLRRAPWFEPTGDERGDYLAAYDSEIRHVDEHVRELFEHFGWERDTLVVVTSDHGEEFWDHGGVDHGHTLYAEVLDVPLIFYGSDDWRSGLVPAARVGLVDVLPTLAELVGLPAREHHEGRSLVPDLRDPDAARAGSLRYAHLEREMRDASGALRTIETRAGVRGRFKLIARRDGDSRERLELFDLETDPRERRDLSGERGALAAELRGVLAELEARRPVYAGERADVTLTPELVQRLRALGYVQ